MKYEISGNDYLDSATTTLMPLFNPDDVPTLRPWLVKNLEPICDAEPEVLSNYVLALLKHDAPESELKKTFESQLYDFLDNETSQFVDQLFTVLKSKSFKTSTSAPSAPPPSAPIPVTSTTPAPPSAPAPVPTALPSTSKDTGIPIPLDALLGPKADSRGTKRRLDSDSGPGDLSRSPPKGPRLRDSAVSRYDTSNGAGRSENGTRGYRDERDRDRAWDRDGRNGVRNHAPPTAPAAERAREERNSKRQPCRDYHERGFCARGNNCIFSHGEEAVTPMGFPPMMGMMGPNFMMPWLMNQLGAGGYDPSQSRMNMSSPQPPAGTMDVIMDAPAPTRNTNPTDAKVVTPPVDTVPTNGANVARNPSTRGGHGAYGRNMRGRGTPAGSWSGDAEPFDGQGQNSGSEPRRDKTLVVEKIPPERLSLEEINNWFKKFGTVTNVAIDVPSAKALVSFSTHDEARDAWRSEDAVFGNRFVKLYWHRPMGNHGQAGAKLLAASAPIINNLSAPPKAEPAPIKSGPSHPPAAIDPSQQKFERLMAEQKVLMVKLTSAQVEEKQSIKARLRELITELQEVSAAMRNGSSTPTPPASKPASTPPIQANGTASKKEELDKDLEMMAPESETAKSETDTSSTVNPELQAKLKKLREEAASLGLNAEGAPTHPTPSYRPYGSRGRGAWRGRGGRGGPPRGSMKLDNRPRTLVVKGLPDTPEAIESAKAWFSSFPESELVEVNPTGELEVKYKTRFSAEQALTSGATIPALGTITFAWPTATTNGASASTAAAPPKNPPVVDTPAPDSDVPMKSHTDADEDGWGATRWDDDDEDGGRRDRM